MNLFSDLEEGEEYNTIGEYDSDGFSLLVLEKLGTIQFHSKNAMNLKKFSDFKNSHEFFNDTGVNIGLTAINAYTKNQNMTAKIFAKTPYERKFYDKIIGDLVKTGEYVIRGKRFVNGGVMTEIERTSK